MINSQQTKKVKKCLIYKEIISNLWKLIQTLAALVRLWAIKFVCLLSKTLYKMMTWEE
jgi:hypothetical protein